jgi:hypothetical protein
MRDGARRIAANIAKLPELLERSQATIQKRRDLRNWHGSRPTSIRTPVLSGQ